MEFTVSLNAAKENNTIKFISDRIDLRYHNSQTIHVNSVNGRPLTDTCRGGRLSFCLRRNQTSDYRLQNSPTSRDFAGSARHFPFLTGPAGPSARRRFYRAVEQRPARLLHAQEIAGSNPARAIGRQSRQTSEERLQTTDFRFQDTDGITFSFRSVAGPKALPGPAALFQTSDFRIQISERMAG